MAFKMLKKINIYKKIRGLLDKSKKNHLKLNNKYK